MAPPRAGLTLGRRLFNRFLGSAVSNAAGYGMGTAIAPVLEPVTQDLTNEAWERHPVKPLGPGAAAEAVIRDLWQDDTAAAEAKRSGIDGDRFDVLRGLAGEPPGAAQLLELRNRDLIGDAELETGLRQSRLRPEWYDSFKQLRHILVPVSDLVRMAVREVFSPAQRSALDLDADYPAAFEAEALKLGLSPQAARDYWAAHWNLPSREEGAAMLYRGEITSAEYDQLLRALDYAPVWRPKLRAITQAIPSITDFIRFAVREVFSPAQRSALDLDADYPAVFTAKARLHGMSEEDARDYWAAHWRLPSATQAFQMRHRDVIDDVELRGLLRALDYAPVWRGRLEQIAYLKPGRVDLRRMFAAGVIDRARVLRGYKDLGYTDADAETLTAFAVQLAQGQQTTKHATKAEITDEYEAGYITGDQLRDGLTRLGYVGAELEAELLLADARRVKRYRERVITATSKAFVDRKIDDARALELLGSVRVTGDTAQQLLGLWRLEQSVKILVLTPAQIKRAYIAGVIDQATAVAELVERGYSAEDAAIYLAE